MSLKRFGAAALAATVALSLAACAGGSNEGSGKAISSSTLKSHDYMALPYDKLKNGGTYTRGIGELTPQLNTQHADATGDTSKVSYWYNPQPIYVDANLDYVLNKNYILSVDAKDENNKTVVTYKLNPQAKYNDGTPIDWKVFEATWKTQNGQNPAYNVSSTEGYKLIESVKPGADDSVIVTFNRVYPWWRGLFNTLVRPELVDPDKFNSAYLKNAHPEWGAGPYKLTKIDFDRGFVTFEQNEKWWGPKGKLDKVTYEVKEATASLNAFRNGEINATGAGDKDRLSQISDMANINIYKAINNGNALLMLNSKSKPLTDLNVRKAVMYGIDRSELAKISFNGLNYTEPLPGSLVLFSYQKGYQDNFAKVWKYDPQEAAKLLDAAGWKMNDQTKIREKDGQPLTLRYPITGSSLTLQAEATATQAMLKNIGVDVKVEQRPANEFSSIYTKHDFDIFSLQFTVNDPNSVSSFGQVYASDSALNLSGTGTKELDKQIEAMNELPTAEEQTKRANQLEVEAFKQYGVMPLMNGPQIIAVQKGLANVGAMGMTSLEPQDIGWADTTPAK